MGFTFLWINLLQNCEIHPSQCARAQGGWLQNTFLFIEQKKSQFSSHEYCDCSKQVPWRWWESFYNLMNTKKFRKTMMFLGANWKKKKKAFTQLTAGWNVDPWLFKTKLILKKVFTAHGYCPETQQLTQRDDNDNLYVISPDHCTWHNQHPKRLRRRHKTLLLHPLTQPDLWALHLGHANRWNRIRCDRDNKYRCCNDWQHFTIAGLKKRPRTATKWLNWVVISQTTRECGKVLAPLKEKCTPPCLTWIYTKQPLSYFY